MPEESAKKLRQRILAARDALSEKERSRRSTLIIKTLLGRPEINGASHIFVYMDFRSEVGTGVLINSLLGAGKTVSIPFTLKDEARLLAVRITDPDNQVRPGYCGIPEPDPGFAEEWKCAPAEIDVVIVPGSVFDPGGGRLGYGGGFYDRFLGLEAKRAIRIGLAFELQLVDRVPVQDHDQFMDFLVTEKKTYTCRR